MAYLRINEIKSTDNSIDSDEIEMANDIIEALLITRKVTIPGSRAFGLSHVFVDMPAPDAVNMITVELAEATDEYIPTLELQDVSATTDTDGTLALDIRIGRR